MGKYAHEFGRFFNNPTGVAYRDETWGRKWIKYGVEGSGDIYGFTLTGQIIYLEAKTGNATQAANQVKFEAMVKKFGGLYFVFRSKEEALECVLRAVSCNSR